MANLHIFLGTKIQFIAFLKSQYRFSPFITLCHGWSCDTNRKWMSPTLRKTQVSLEYSQVDDVCRMRFPGVCVGIVYSALLSSLLDLRRVTKWITAGRTRQWTSPEARVDYSKQRQQRSYVIKYSARDGAIDKGPEPNAGIKHTIVV